MKKRRLLTSLLCIILFGSPCAAAERSAPGFRSLLRVDPAAVLNRITWGVNETELQRAASVGIDAYLEAQLNPFPAVLPEPVANRIASMAISQKPLELLVRELEGRRKEALATAADREEAIIVQRAHQKAVSLLGLEASARSLLRALYSPNQLQEQMVWFWVNHFSIYQGKSGLGAMVGDFEESAIRPNALGKFGDLLKAVVHHPAMLRYLNNAQNASGHINENYARELMELHTLGADGGYGQQDVQELARILTGLGINQNPDPPNVKKELLGQYIRNGLTEFNPNRHEYGEKKLLGVVITGQGMAEIDAAVTLLGRHPSTARYVSRKLAVYFVQDEPTPDLITRMSAAFLESDGDIAHTLRVMLTSPEFASSLGRKFKDPMHYVVSAVRLAYDGAPISNVTPMITWLNRLGQPLYGRHTPDGYPMTRAAWASSGQMTSRFEVARAVAAGNPELFRTPEDVQGPKAPPTRLAHVLQDASLGGRFGPATRQALARATSPLESGMLLLASPEAMHR